MENSDTIRRLANSKVPLAPKEDTNAAIDDNFDAVLEAEIDAFYSTMFSDEEISAGNSDEDFHDEVNQDLIPRSLAPGELDVPPAYAGTALTRAAQLDAIGESKSTCVFLTVNRMFQSYEFQLWEIVPLITVKELIEDITEVTPENMRMYTKNGDVVEDSKMLKDYGITTNIATADNPFQLFVGFRVDLEEVSDEEAGDEDDEDDENDTELSQGLQYFETLSDIDFTTETTRDRDFDDSEAEVEYNPTFKLMNPENNFPGRVMLRSPSPLSMEKMKANQEAKHTTQHHVTTPLASKIIS